MANPWIEHVKAYASQNNMPYKEAMKDRHCKDTYESQKGGNIFKDVKKSVSKAANKSIDYLGDTKNRQYGKNIMKGINVGNKYIQAVGKPLASVPIIGAPAKAIVGVSQASTNLSNKVYKDVKPKNKTYFLDQQQGAGVNDNPFKTRASDEIYQLSSSNPRRQNHKVGGSFRAMGGSFRAMGDR